MTDHDSPTGQTGGPTMTDDFRSAPGAPPGPQRRLMRSESDERIAGVAGGIGRYLGIDAVIVRIAFVLLALAGGGGVALYLVCWLLMPDDDGSQVAAAQPASFSDSPQWLRVALVGGGALIVLLRVLDGGSSLWWGLLLIGAGVLLFRDDDHAGSAAAPPPGSAAGPDGPSAPPAGGVADDVTGDDALTRRLDDRDAAGEAAEHTLDASLTAPPEPTSALVTRDLGTPVTLGADVPAGQGQTWRDAGWDQGFGTDSWGAGALPDPATDPATGWSPPGSPGAPAGVRQPSPLGRVTVALATIVVGFAALVDRLGGPDLTTARALALALLMVGIGCLVGAFAGRGRGLIGAGLLLLPLLLVSATVGAVSDRGDLRSATMRPTTLADLDQPIEIGTGDVVVDLRALDASDTGALPVPVQVRLGAGRLHVLVPAEAGFEVNARTGAGEVRVEDLPGQHLQSEAGLGVNASYSSPSSDAGTFELDLAVGAGQITVERGAARAAPTPTERSSLDPTPTTPATPLTPTAPTTPEELT